MPVCERLGGRSRAVSVWLDSVVVVTGRGRVASAASANKVGLCWPLAARPFDWSSDDGGGGLPTLPLPTVSVLSGNEKRRRVSPEGIEPIKPARCAARVRTRNGDVGVGGRRVTSERVDRVGTANDAGVLWSGSDRHWLGKPNGPLTVMLPLLILLSLPATAIGEYTKRLEDTHSASDCRTSNITFLGRRMSSANYYVTHPSATRHCQDMLSASIN